MDTATDPGGVAAFTIGSTGALTPIAGSPVLAGPASTPMGPFIAAIDPAGKFVYTSNLDGSCCPGTQAVSVFAVGASGALTAISGSPFNLSLEWAHYIVIDPSGKFAYALDSNNDQIQGFSVGTTGALTPLSGTPFTDTAMQFPTSMVITH
jgi:6-phosphogluconolactonase (cycloisomerase 2 family)